MKPVWIAAAAAAVGAAGVVTVALVWTEAVAPPAAETPTPAAPPQTPPPPPTPDPEGADSEPTPGEPAPALVGVAEVDDGQGDVADPDGHPPPDPEPAADLLEVRLEGDGDALVITFTLAGVVPESAASLLWELEIRDGDEPLYTVGAQLVGEEWFSGVFDWEAQQQEPLPTPPAVRDEQLVVSVPSSLLARVEGPFAWVAATQYDGAFEDRAPDAGEVPFPQRETGR